MYTLFDPSIKPVIVTDFDGNTQYIRTYGLHYYNYPDIVLDSEFEKYSQIFDTIIHSMFQLRFRMDEVWSMGSQECSLEMVGENLAKVIITDIDDIRITTIHDPITGAQKWKRTQGLYFYQHPEIHVSTEIPQADELLEYIIDSVKKGEKIDDSYELTYEETNTLNVFELSAASDRFGKECLFIKEKRVLNETIITKVKSSHLRRIK